MWCVREFRGPGVAAIPVNHGEPVSAGGRKEIHGDAPQVGRRPMGEPEGAAFAEPERDVTLGMGRRRQ